MHNLQTLLERNKRWAADVTNHEPNFFAELAKEQKPGYLWIGCSDSRVPASRIVDLPPGELFVHRNIAHLVVHTDLNSLSVIQYAVEALGIEHIIVCGHYGCGGVTAAMGNESRGLIDHWLQHIRDVYRRHVPEIEALSDESDRINRLCELNVMEQVSNVSRTAIVQNAWQSGRQLAVHGLMYRLKDGRLTDLEISLTGPDQTPVLHQ